MKVFWFLFKNIVGVSKCVIRSLECYRRGKGENKIETQGNIEIYEKLIHSRNWRAERRRRRRSKMEERKETAQIKNSLHIENKFK